MERGARSFMDVIGDCYSCNGAHDCSIFKALWLFYLVPHGCTTLYLQYIQHIDTFNVFGACFLSIILYLHG